MIGVLRPIDDKLAWIHVFKQYFSNLRHLLREKHDAFSVVEILQWLGVADLEHA